MSSSSSASGQGKQHGFFYIALATFLFSSMEIALKTVAGQFNALQLNFLRFLIGGLFLLPFALRSLRKRHSAIRPRDMGFFALSGLTCVVASMTLYQLAIQSCRASIVAILFSCNPVVVIPLAAIFLKERIRGFTIATMILSVAGMVCIMNPFDMSASPAGIFLTLGSAVVFAAYAVMGKTKSVAFGGLATTAFSFIIGSGELFVLILASRIQAVAGMLRTAGFGNFADIPLFAGLDLRVLPVFAYISLCVTGTGYAAYFMAIEESSSATASLVFYIKPAMAPILAFLVLGESIAASTFAGIVLVTLGSAISFAGSRRVKHPNRELRT